MPSCRCGCHRERSGRAARRDMDAIHFAMPKALHTAAKAASVRRVVLISAISARSDVSTDYSQSKLAGKLNYAHQGWIGSFYGHHWSMAMVAMEARR